MSDWKPTYESKLKRFENYSNKPNGTEIEVVIQPSGKMCFQRFSGLVVHHNGDIVKFRDFLTECLEIAESAPELKDNS